MPELPEVETVKRILEPQLSGQTILSAEVLHPQIISYPDADSFQTTDRTKNNRHEPQRKVSDPSF